MTKDSSYDLVTVGCESMVKWSFYLCNLRYYKRFPSNCLDCAIISKEKIDKRDRKESMKM